MQLLMSIHDYTVENALSMGELNLFSSDNRDEVNRKVVDYLKSLSHQLQDEQSRPTVSPDFVIAYPRSYRQRVFQWVCDVS